MVKEIVSNGFLLNRKANLRVWALVRFRGLEFSRVGRLIKRDWEFLSYSLFLTFIIKRGSFWIGQVGSQLTFWGRFSVG